MILSVIALLWLLLGLTGSAGAVLLRDRHLTVREVSQVLILSTLGPAVLAWFAASALDLARAPWLDRVVVDLRPRDR